MIKKPSVTQIIDPWCDFTKIPPDRLEAACARGTKVHDFTANIARGLVIFNVPPELDGYIVSFRRWFDAMVQEVIFVEHRMTDEAFQFTGQPDIFIKTKTGESDLIDNKTPITLQKAWRLQMAGYDHLTTKNFYKPDRVGSLRLHPEGKVPKMEWYESTAADFPIFLQALNLTRYFNS